MKKNIFYIVTFLFLGTHSLNAQEAKNANFENVYLAVEQFENESSDLKALIFLSESCPCSKSHIVHIQDLLSRFKNLKIFGVISEPAQNSKDQTLQDDYFKTTQFGFPIIQDPKQTLVKKYKALKTPHVVLFQKNKSEEFEIVYEGGLTDSKTFSASSKKYLELGLNDILIGQDVKEKKGFCLGCYIRRF